MNKIGKISIYAHRFNKSRVYAIPKCGYTTTSYYFLKYNYPDLFKNNIISDKSKLIYKTIKKAKEAQDIRGEIGFVETEKDKIDHKYYIFVRNPFDRIYSSFMHRKKAHKIGNFNIFVQKKLKNIMFEDVHFFPMSYILPEINPDTTIMNFKNFNTSFQNILSASGFSEDRLKNCNKKSKKLSYLNVYNKKSIDIVFNLYKWDIQKFQFDFKNQKKDEFNFKIKDIL